MRNETDFLNFKVISVNPKKLVHCARKPSATYQDSNLTLQKAVEESEH